MSAIQDLAFIDNDFLEETLPRDGTAQGLELGGSDRGKEFRIRMDRQTGFGHGDLWTI